MLATTAEHSNSKESSKGEVTDSNNVESKENIDNNNHDPNNENNNDKKDKNNENNNDNDKEKNKNENNDDKKDKKIKIESVSIKDYKIENSEVHYNIYVRTTENSSITKKRYHHFDELHSQLSQKTSKKLPLLPPKHSKLITDHTDSVFVEQRRALLDNYVKKLLKIKDIGQSSLVINFLNDGAIIEVANNEAANENCERDVMKNGSDVQSSAADTAKQVNENKENGNENKQENGKSIINKKFSDNYEFPSDQEVTHISIQQVRKMSDHVLYQILVMNSHKRASFRQWMQLKRFTQFYEMDCKLRSSLIAEHPSFNVETLPPTPPRRLKFIHDHMDDDFIEERRVLLENYLSHLLRLPQVAKNEHFLEFLGVGAN